MATPFSRSLQPRSLYDKWSLMVTATDTETWCLPVHTWYWKYANVFIPTHFDQTDVFSKLNLISKVHLASWPNMLKFGVQHGRTHIHKYSVSGWIDSIWGLINSMHKAGSGRFLLSSLLWWTQICLSPTLIIHVPLTTDKLFRAYSNNTLSVTGDFI